MLNQPKIIVASDFSEGSNHALRAGERIRSLSRGTLTLVHVTSTLNEVALGYLPDTYKEEHLKDLNKRMTQQLATCDAQGRIEILYGNPARAIQEYAQKMAADLIITGPKGTGLTPEFLGSVTSRLISTSDIPLLIVKRPFELNKVAGLIEASLPLEEIFSATEEFGFLFNAQIEYLSFQQDMGALALGNLPIKTKSYTRFEPEEINDVKRAMSEIIRRYMEPESKATVRTEVSEERIPVALKRMLDQNGVDLAVLSRNQRNLLEKIFVGSVTRRLLETFEGNILVLPPEVPAE